MKNGPHILLASDSGTGKSSFAASIIQRRNPRPVLIQAFDPSDKLTPYRRRGTVVYEDWQYGQRELIQQDGKTLAIIERWHESQGRGSRGVTMKGGIQVDTIRRHKQGTAFEKYLKRMEDFEDEVEDYYAFILDSSTFLELAVRSYLSGVMRVKDNQMIWGQATDEIERLMMFQLPELPITTMVLSHVGAAQEKGEDGKDKFQLRLPGRLGKDPFAAFGEIYRAYVTVSRGDDGMERNYWLQTRADSSWRCGSQINVPDPMEPHWKHVVQAMKEAGLEVE